MLGAFRRDLQAALQYVTAYPLDAAAHSHDVRGRRLMHFPYTVLYRVHDHSILFPPIAHQSREPEHYASRFE